MGNFKIYIPGQLLARRISCITAPAMLLSFLSAALYTSRGFPPSLSPPLFSVLPHSRAQWIVIIMMALRWLSRPVLRGERENGPGDGGIPFCVFRRRPPSDPDLLTPFDMRYEPFFRISISDDVRELKQSFCSLSRLKRHGAVVKVSHSIASSP